MTQDDKKNDNPSTGSLLSEMVISGKEKSFKEGGLVVDPNASEEEQFTKQLGKSLRDAEEAVISFHAGAIDSTEAKRWQRAGDIVENFKPVPWFIWRLSHYVLGNPDHINELTEGLVFGLRRLLFGAASDPVLGCGEKVKSVRKALTILDSDVIAAVSVLYAICKKLSSRQFERMWGPILEDALLRARIGYSVGLQNHKFGAGRGMLAGFAGRCGLAILFSSGELDQARSALEMLANGAEIGEVGIKVYQCDPLQVSAMALSAAGCGVGAAYGVASYNLKLRDVENQAPDQAFWLSSFYIIENVRMGTPENIDPQHWEAMGFDSEEKKDELLKEAKLVVRRGHGWSWLA